MLFSSIVFIVYFLPIALTGYYVLKFSRTAQNGWLLLMSLVFYAWGEPAFVPLLLLSILINHFMLHAVYRARENRGRPRRLTVVICAFNLTVLLACKHLLQIAGSIEFILNPASGSLPDIAIPLGISFFTLRAVSFAIDVYKGVAVPPKNPVNTALYLTFFPSFIAGPVMRFSDMDEQLRNRREAWQGFSAGVCRFITGLAKKVLIANSMAAIANHVFSYSAMSNEVTQVPVLLAWVGVIAFTLQIYFDLSGCADMAIGLGRMFGFELPENFDYPFTALSLTEFWSRWNITLIGWFREYIYFPLGGSLVKNKDKMVRNIFILWLFVGIWHGSTWTFVLWGVWQFLFLVLERVTNFDKRKPKKTLRRIYVAAVVLSGFVIFRTSDIYQATLYFSNMLGLNHNGFTSATALMFVREYWFFIAAGILFVTPVARKLSGFVRGRDGFWGSALSAVYPALMIAVFCIAMSYVFRGGIHPFIYFKF